MVLRVARVATGRNSHVVARLITCRATAVTDLAFREKVGGSAAACAQHLGQLERYSALMPTPAEASSLRLPALYEQRFHAEDLAAKRLVWRVLCRHFFQRYVPDGATVLDLAAGSCEFVNQITADRRIAVDVNPEVQSHADSSVEVLHARADDLSGVEDATVHVVFASNFFEHLTSPEELLAALAEAHRVLVREGRLLILQPNIRLIGGRYWDFLDHRLPLTERSLGEACAMAGFEVVERRIRFLPYTTKSRMPQHPLFVRAYLSMRPLQLLFGKQTFMVCRPADRDSTAE
jgi:SAM-dependent methyltransferase